jgi:hypothetical protein
MKSLVLSALVLSVSGAALAGPACNVPKEKWMAESSFKKGLQDQGYRILLFKVSKGDCYEVYGVNRSGQKVKVYFDPETSVVAQSQVL